MGIPLPTYAKIKDKYCIVYNGNNYDYLVQLKLLRPFMEKTYPGVQVYIAHKDDAGYIFQNTERTLPRSQLEKSRHEFAYVRELACDMVTHPIENFMKESDIPCGPIPTGVRKKTKLCVVVSHGMLPTRALDAVQIERVIKHAESEGYEVSVNGEIEKAEFVIGVESEKLFEAGASGCKVTLISTGVGENIFKCMFPHGSILKI